MPYKDSLKRRKVERISHWKSRGLIGDYEKIYQRYLNTTNCDLCNLELCSDNKSRNRKCMDHCHATGEFRNIVCHSCNSKKTDSKKPKTNKSGYKNISYSNTRKCWVYQKTFKGKFIKVRKKNKIDILCIKFAGILLFRY